MSASFAADPARYTGTRPDDLPSSLIIPTPSEYGHYCSIVDGNASYLEWGGNDFNPCGDMLSRLGSSPNAKVRLAKGLVTDLGAFSIDLWKTDNGYKRPPVQPDKNPHS